VEQLQHAIVMINAIRQRAKQNKDRTGQDRTRQDRTGVRLCLYERPARTSRADCKHAPTTTRARLLHRHSSAPTARARLQDTTNPRLQRPPTSQLAHRSLRATTPPIAPHPTSHTPHSALSTRLA
jgi:hypothetical protein